MSKDYLVLRVSGSAVRASRLNGTVDDVGCHSTPTSALQKTLDFRAQK